MRPAAGSAGNLQAMQQAGAAGMAPGMMAAAGARPGQQPTPQQLQQMMQTQAAIHAQFAASAPGRAPSPGMPVSVRLDWEFCAWQGCHPSPPPVHLPARRTICCRLSPGLFMSAGWSCPATAGACVHTLHLVGAACPAAALPPF